MNPRKQKEKDRRRARKLAEEAWEAVNAGNFDLAEKIIRRAVVAQPDNPVSWNDLGIVLALRRKDADAAAAFRTAINLAPNFAEPFAQLATLRIQQGFVREAIALQREAVKQAPENAVYAARLEAYLALDDPKNSAPTQIEQAPSAVELGEATVEPDVQGDWQARLSSLDWTTLGERLTRDAYIRIDGLVGADNCDRLRSMFDDDTRFAKTVVMDRPEFGLGVYRYFRAPIPDVVDQLRRVVYPHVAQIANSWQQLLGEEELYPMEWEGFRERCRSVGQTTPTPILLKYEAGGFNALHRDLRGSVYFPIQMAVVLSPLADPCLPQNGFQGGEFLLCDVPEGKKARRRAIPAGLGDVLLFCTRDRLVQVGGVYGLQPVKHGAAPIISGTRFVLGVPFHEYR